MDGRRRGEKGNGHGVIKLPPMTESQWQAQVVQFAKLNSWRVAHFRSVRISRANGTTHWATPVEADGEGFPDLLCVRPGLILAAELKRDGGRVSAEQKAWLRAFEAAGVPAYVWMPRDWDEVQEVLGQ